MLRVLRKLKECVRHQVDVIFSSDSVLEEGLSNLEITYWTCQCNLGQFLDFARLYVSQTALESKITAVGIRGPTSEDTWCLDPRGFLTLSVGKETYEALGLVGEPLPWKEHRDLHAIHISLRDSCPESDDMKTWLKYGRKEVDAIRRWDLKRQHWKIFFHCAAGLDNMLPNSVRHVVKGKVQRLENCRIPEPRPYLAAVSQASGNAEDAEDWEECLSSLFEWVGMAALASPRLFTNDGCDPYIAVYTPPEPSRVGDITTIRWSGFLSSVYLDHMLDVILSTDSPSPSLVSVTAQSIGMSPVSYLPRNVKKAPPRRVPRVDAEDVWSLIFVRENGNAWWASAESIGQWDRRWG
ncbi:ribonuclease P 40kDa subunit-domain-containing protein [Trametes punicea]|nr:ribonuclease P 40kDa subunit-domain-containing protein [Trametes punicea]